ncbi:hypothetical protein [Streptomyces sp. NPDC101249]|uniref:hypothetical protein n=1 Tax=Streptomyces sp. NPDC101249 TaxID=3366140 RepID=UPI003821E304
MAPGAPGRAAAAPPDSTAPTLRGPLLLFALGIGAIVSGLVGAGVGALAVAGVWGWFVWQVSEEAARARAEWENKRICRACSEQWTP